MKGAVQIISNLNYYVVGNSSKVTESRSRTLLLELILDLVKNCAVLEKNGGANSEATVRSFVAWHFSGCTALHDVCW